VTLSALIVGACSGGDPQRLSVQQYDTTLAGTVDPLETALKALASAKAYEGLADRVTAVETAADQAVTELTEITPPAELATKHSQLITALEAFHDDLGGLSSQVDDRALCTGSAVRAELGNANGTSGLRDALAAVSVKLPDDRHTITLPAAGQKPGTRPANGQLLRAGHLDGRGELTIKNGGADAVVTLSEGRKPGMSVFVRNDKQTTVRGLRDGLYTVYFTSGTRWDGKARAFGRNCTFQRLEKQSTFSTTASSYTVLSFTLYPVVGGNAPTKDVDPDDFPDS
jgi:hypothetical protein